MSFRSQLPILRKYGDIQKASRISLRELSIPIKSIVKTIVQLGQKGSKNILLFLDCLNRIIRMGMSTGLDPSLTIPVYLCTDYGTAL